MIYCRRLALALAALLLDAAALRADVKLAAVFTDHAVLQRDAVVPVWGTAKHGEKLTVAFGGQTIATKADRDGNWRVDFAPMPACAAPADLVVDGNNVITLHDVLVGDVWLCADQSGLETPLHLSQSSPLEASTAQLPLIRHFKVALQSARERPADDVQGSWTVCTPDTVSQFSAIGFHFARELHYNLGVPIGLLDISWSGTPLESWLPPATLAASPHAAAVAAAWARTVSEYPQRKAAYDLKFADWQRRAEAAKTAGQPEPGNRPWRPAGPGMPEEPTVVWQGMVAPILPFALRGVLWYQGDANVGSDAEYHDLFPALIRGWREAWQQATDTGPTKEKSDRNNGKGPAPAPLARIADTPLPFLFVQLPNYADNVSAPDSWARLREAQAAALTLPATGMAVTLDLGEGALLHSSQRQEVGRRLALIARAQVYGEGLDCTGPTYAGHSLESGAIRVRFDHAQIGLVCHGNRLQGFVVAGADRVFQPAEARLDGDCVVITSAAVKAPMAARYAFANDPLPAPNLCNGAGLPAAPFRTDNW